VKSDYKVLLFCLALLCCLAGLFYAVDTKVDIITPSPSGGFCQRAKCSRGEVALGESSLGETTPSHLGEAAHSLFVFDPNTAEAGELLRLGLPRFMVRGILKYRAKGGVYSTPEDFARVPGLTQKKYKELLPYIKISPDFQPASLLVPPRRPRGKGSYDKGSWTQSSSSLLVPPRGKGSTGAINNVTGTSNSAAGTTNGASGSKYPKKMGASERLAVNNADTTDLQRVPGIGRYFAKKIVEYREKLGGFTSLDQLLEIKNFPESALEYLTIPDGNIRRININRASFTQLAAHPYIGYSRTKIIVDYRRLKGKITSLSQLSLMKGFSAEEISRMEPYIEY